MAVSAAQRELMRHALGLTRGKEEYRNHFVATDGSPDCVQWRELVKLGCATAKVFGGADRSTIFFVTDKGRAAARRSARQSATTVPQGGKE